MENISVPTGEIIGIGKLKMSHLLYGNSVRFPEFSFVVAKSEDGNYTASCLNLCLDAISSQHNEAVDRLVTTCNEFITTLFALCPDTAWEQLFELADSDDSEWWKAYRQFEILLAKNGIDTHTEITGITYHYRQDGSYV